MPDDPRVSQLLDELLDSQATPEEVCRESPELLPEVRERWRQLCRVRADLDALFPTRRDPGPGLAAPSPDGAVLPTIRGYEVEAVLGRGGMGIVFRARHLRLARVVALKMLLADAYAGPQERERFRREAQAVAGLRHPNVVQVYDVGESEGRSYFTMEFIDGGSLAQKLAGTPQAPRQAAGLLATLAGAVHAAHAGGIVHRDLKPANVLLTADGTPKVSDFGLARRLGEDHTLTRTGTVLGTPSYMAPEQARGEGRAVGVATDVYALGAMLYELLTGRPPFRAETEPETLNQVVSKEPVPPSRLNASVPRDLETICLKCLRKEPRLRYAGAAALADDLHRFLRGEAIAARPEGPVARLVRRVRRRPVLAAAVAVAALASTGLVGVGAWTLSERAAARRAAAADREATERAAEDDLRDMSRFLRQSSWPEARAALGRAKLRLGDRVPDDLGRRIGQGERELDLAARLEAVRLERAVSTAAAPDWDRSMREYEAIFREAGLAQLREDPDAVAGRVGALDIRLALADALDDWARCARLDRPTFGWLLAVAGRADPDTSPWRATARTLKTKWPSPAATAEVAEAALRATRCDPLLLGLGQDIATGLKDPTPFLTRVQQAHPGDLFANLELAEELVVQRRPAEAVRYYQGALAIRPEAPNACHKLGLVLGRLGRNDEAVEYLRRAVRLAPATAEYRRNLVLGLRAAGRPDASLGEARRAFREVPPSARSRAHVGSRVQDVPATARLHAVLGDVLAAGGREPEAIDEYRQALALEPGLAEALTPLRAILVRRGRFEDLRAAWGAALDRGRPEHDDYYGYAELCLYLGRQDDYRAARRTLLRVFAEKGYWVTAERTARACLLLPATDDELARAAVLADRAAALDRAKAKEYYPYFQFAGGLADYRRGRCEKAITTMRGEAAGVLGPAPQLVLAMALHQNGQSEEARRTLAAAVAGHDWRPEQVRDQNDWIFHILRREAEAMIQPNPAACPVRTTP